MTFNCEKFYSLTEFIEWCKSKGESTYNYYDKLNCVLSQWARECGAGTVTTYGLSIDIDGNKCMMPSWESLVFRSYSYVNHRDTMNPHSRFSDIVYNYNNADER